MSDVPLRSSDAVELMEPSHSDAALVEELQNPRPFAVAKVVEKQAEEIIDRALLENNSAIHVGFAKIEIGI